MDGEKIAQQLMCAWFVADFAQTREGLQLVELNPGWCAGVTHAASARAIHLAILSTRFGVAVATGLWPKPEETVGYVGKA